MDYGFMRAKARAKKNKERKQQATVKERKAQRTPELIFYNNFPEKIDLYLNWSTTEAPALQLVERLQNSYFQLLSLPTGVGKTAICVRSLAILQEKLGKPLSFLLVMSRAIKEQRSWEQTILNWNDDHPDLPRLKPLMIETYDRFANILSDARSLKSLLQSLEPDTIIVLDEVHKYKNPTSKRAKQLQKLTKFKKIGLSATPLTNNLVLDGGSYLIMNRQFPNKTQFIQRTGLEQRTGEYGQFLIYDSKNRVNKHLWPYWPIFKKQLSDVILRPQIDIERLDMPKVKEIYIPLQENDSLLADVNSLSRAYKMRVFDSITDYLVELAYRIAIDSSRIQMIVDLCKKHIQPLIFYLHVAVGDAYEEALIKEGFKPQRLDGSHSIGQIDLESDQPVLVQYQAGSEGVEFKHSDCSIFAQNQYSYSLLTQARGRNVRRSMKHVVSQYTLVSEVYFDSAIVEKVNQREELSEEVLLDIAENN